MKQSLGNKAATTARCLLIFAYSFIACNSAHATQDVSIISTENKYQKEFSQAISLNLDSRGITNQIITPNEVLLINDNNQVLISIGSTNDDILKTNKISNKQIKIVSSIDENHGQPRNGVIYLSMTQDTCQQFEFINAINPEWKKIGILIPENHKSSDERLIKCAKKNNQSINQIIVNNYINIVDAIKTELPKSDVLLALPDHNIYNAKTIKSILLTTYRLRKPLIGYSESFVRAGALAAIHSSVEQLGNKTAEIAESILQNKTISKQYFYPDAFDISTNKDVAKSLGITIQDTETLIDKLKSKQHD